MTMYAQIIDNRIEATGNLPTSARRLDTGDWVMGLDTAPPDLRAATGWVEVVDTPRPADTATTAHDHSVELVDGTPTVVWTERPKTADEQAAETQQATQRTIEDRARQALATNRTYLDLASTTAAQQAAQVKALTRQNQALIRLLLRAFDTTD